MQLPPVDVLLSFPEPNYINPTDVRGPAIIIMALVFVPLTVVVVVLRVYTRLRISKSFGADDFFMLAAVVPTFGCSVISILLAVNNIWTRHVWDVPLDKLSLGLKYQMAIEVLFALACTLAKMSLLTLIIRIMSATNSVLRAMTITVMVVISVETVIFIIMVINTCSPLSAYWTLSSTPQKCINETHHLLAAGVINTITDFCVVLIPIPIVLKVQLPRRQQIILVMVFGAGFIVCIAGAVRIYFTYQVTSTFDKSWMAYPEWIAATLELYCGIIAGSIPALKQLLTRYIPELLGITHRRQTHVSLSSKAHIRSGRGGTDIGIPKRALYAESRVEFIEELEDNDLEENDLEENDLEENDLEENDLEENARPVPLKPSMYTTIT